VSNFFSARPLGSFVPLPQRKKNHFDKNTAKAPVRTQHRPATDLSDFSFTHGLRHFVFNNRK
jgi:hypothetical protein